MTAESSWSGNTGLWPLERVLSIIPAVLDGLTVRPCSSEVIEERTVLYVQLGVSEDGAGWIRATRTHTPVTRDDVDNDQTIYYPPALVRGVPGPGRSVRGVRRVRLRDRQIRCDRGVDNCTPTQ